MLKLLYKTLLISVLSGSLTMTNMTALAEGSITKGSDGVLTKTETQSFDSTKNENAVNVIAMLAVAAVGTKLMMYAKKTTDMQLAAVASLAYVAGEILNVANMNDQVKKQKIEISKRSDGKQDLAQIAALEDLKASYEKAKKSSKTKMMLQNVAMMAFGAATAVAAYQRVTETGQLASCQAGITSAQASLATCTAEQTALAAAATASVTGSAAAAAFTREAAACTACSGTLGILSTKVASAAVSDEMILPSVTQSTTSMPQHFANLNETVLPCGGVTAAGIKSTFVVPSCTTYLTTKKLNVGFGAAFVASNDNSIPGLEKILFANDLKNNNSEKMSFDLTFAYQDMIKKMLNAVLPSAEASDGIMGMLGLGAGAAAAFFTAKTALGTTIDTFLFTPGKRIIAWGMMTGIAALGKAATQKEIDKVDDNIKKIDQILAELNKLEDGIKTQNVHDQQITLTNFAINPNDQIPYNSDPKIKTECLGGPGTNNCPPLATQFKSLPGYASLPDSFKSIISQSAKIGDGLNGKNSLSGSTLGSANTLAGQVNAIGKTNDALKTKINEALSAAGKPKIDFAKDERNLWAKLKSQTGNALKSNNMTAGAFLASTGLSPIANANAAIAKVPTSSAKTLSGTEASGVEASKEKGFDLDFKEDKSTNTEGVAVAPTKEEKYDIGSNDINTNSGDSIFQVISNRYLKSGYPKLLEEIEVKK